MLDNVMGPNTLNAGVFRWRGRLLLQIFESMIVKNCKGGTVW